MNNIDDLLDKYQKGQLTPEESLLVDNWLSNPDSQYSAWAELSNTAKDNWLKAGLHRINATIDEQETTIAKLPVRKRISWYWPATAAAAVVFIILSVLFYNNQINSHDNLKLAIVKTQANVQKSIRLADGSQVSINAGSELKYPTSFNGKTREVYLSGEGYFDITHNASKPFIIHAGNTVTTVLGTAFNIKEDKINHTVVVTVTRGKVSVANGGQLLAMITPDQQLSFNSSNGQTSKLNVNAIKVIAWQKPALQFEDVTLEEAVTQLEQRFNINITFANNSLKRCRFTGSSLPGDNLSTVLTAICDYNNATFQTRNDGSILISGPGCN